MSLGPTFDNSWKPTPYHGKGDMVNSRRAHLRSLSAGKKGSFNNLGGH